MKLSECVQQFQRDLEANHPTTTARAYAISAQQLADYLGDQPITADSLIGFHRWLSRRGYAKSTLNLRLSALRRFLAWLEMIGELEISSLDKQRSGESGRNLLRRRSAPLPRIPERGVDDKIHEAARGLPVLRDRAIVELLYSSGCRRAEIVGLDVGDLDLSEHSAVVTGKGDKQRRVYYSPLAAELIEKYLRSRGAPRRSEPVFCRHLKNGKTTSKRLSSAYLRDIVREACQIAGIEKGAFTPHSFRHAFAIRMLRATRSLASVQDLLGHKDSNSTRVYATIYPDELRDAHRKVFG